MMDGTGNFTYGLEGIGNGGSDLLGSTLNFTIMYRPRFLGHRIEAYAA